VYIVDSLKLVHKPASCNSEDRHNRGKLGCKSVGESLDNTEDESNNIKVGCIPCQSRAEPILKSSRGRPCGGAERLSVNCVDRVKRKIITSSANQHPKNRLTAKDRGPQGAVKVGRVDIGLGLKRDEGEEV
jgi:hypothetical protein